MQNILFVSHCVLNTASKVVLYDKDEMEAEEALRRRFLQEAVLKGVQIIQLPCPEFTLYGARRWGHVSTQFDNPFFREHCRRLLEPIYLEIEEYLSHGERFCILGVLGIDGSPSCGVDYTGVGKWGGSFGGREDLQETLDSACMVQKRGVLMDVLEQGLKERGFAGRIPVIGLNAREPEKCMSLLRDLAKEE